MKKFIPLNKTLYKVGSIVKRNPKCELWKSDYEGEDTDVYENIPVDGRITNINPRAMSPITVQWKNLSTFGYKEGDLLVENPKKDDPLDLL